MNKLDFELLKKYARKPDLFEKSNASLLWNDEHISKGMLQAHLDPDAEAASRKHGFIDDSTKWIFEYSRLNKGDKILDLGCGPGLYCERFARQGFQVTGIDFSTRSLDYAKQKAVENKLEIEYIHQNYLTIDFTAEYKLIILIYCDLGALANEETHNLLGKVYNALKPGGVFIFDVFTPVKYADSKEYEKLWQYEESGFWRPYPYICLYSHYVYPENDTHLDQMIILDEYEDITVYRTWDHFYTKETITKLLKSVGFNEMEYFSNVAGKGYDDKSETLCVIAKKMRRTF